MAVHARRFCSPSHPGLRLNDDEVGLTARMHGLCVNTLQEFRDDCARRFELKAVCITRGAQGCALFISDESPGCRVRVADIIGAGDAFAAAFLHELNSGLLPGQVADLANRVGAVVASKVGGIPGWTMADIRTLA